MSLSDIHSPAPKETLRIQNFGGITDATIELSRMNVFIGPQASGKSVCAKLIYYFRQFVRDLPLTIIRNNSDKDIDKAHRADFHDRFPPKNWGDSAFEIEYGLGDLKFVVRRLGNDSAEVTLSRSDKWGELIEIARPLYRVTEQSNIRGYLDWAGMVEREKEYIQILVRKGVGQLRNHNNFIDSGRSFFTTLHDITFTLQAREVRIDPFILQLGGNYEAARSFYSVEYEDVRKEYGTIQKHIRSILGGEYEDVGTEEYILHEDGRRVLIENASSGQKEFLPLALILSTIGRKTERAQKTTLFVEEPEAHLYPTAQREMVHLLCTALDLTSPESSSQCVITTHSPYILSALNNLIYGAKLIEEDSSRKDAVREILGETDLVSPKDVRAYHFENGSATRIQDEETGLITADAIDEVSQRLGMEFESLLSVEFAEKAA